MRKLSKKGKIIVGSILFFLIYVVIVLILLLLMHTDKYRVTFDTDGGSNINSVLLQRDSKIMKPDDPVKDGYIFDGWYFDGKKFDFSTKITKDMTLVARWIKADERKIGLEEKNISLNLKETKKINVALSGFDPNVTLSFSSSDEAIVQVDAEGNITAIGVGQAVITIKTSDGLEEIVEVTVSDGTGKLESLTISGYKKVNVGSTIKLAVKFNPDNVANKKVTWSSSDEAIATVDENGRVKGINPGVVTITVTSEEGNISATYTVTVNAISNEVPNETPSETTPENTTVSVSSISISGKNTIKTGETTKLTAIIEPSNATNQGVTWSSNNPSVATVDQDGNVVGGEEGTVIISATTQDGNKVATFTITVEANYVVYLETIKMDVGESLQHTFRVTKNGINLSTNDYEYFIVDNLNVNSKQKTISNNQYDSLNKSVKSATLHLKDGRNIVASVVIV